MPTKRFFIAIGRKPNGTFDKLVYPSNRSQSGKADSNVVERKQKVTWTISNLTNDDIWVKLDKFRYANGNVPSEVPIDFDENPVLVDDRSSKGYPRRNKIKGTVKKKIGGTNIPDKTDFDYDIYAGTSKGSLSLVTDPRLRVDGGDNKIDPPGKKIRKSARIRRKSKKK